MRHVQGAVVGEGVSSNEPTHGYTYPTGLLMRVTDNYCLKVTGAGATSSTRDDTNTCQLMIRTCVN